MSGLVGASLLLAMGNGREPSRVPTGHLYFTSGRRVHHGYEGNVEAYPLVNGLPVASGARTLETSLHAVGNAALGPGGQIFEVGLRHVDHKQPSWTYVYGAGATGEATPIRRFKGAYGSIVVDPLGYTYETVQDSSYEGIDIFSPTARGQAKPVQTINTPNGVLALDARGNLYVDEEAYTGRYVTVFADPVTSPHMIAQFCWTSSVNYDSYAMAIASDGTEYVAEVDGGSHPGRVLVFAPGADTCPAQPIRIITAEDKPFTIINGLAVAGPYLYVLAGEGYLVTMDANKGAQVPLARIAVTPPVETLILGP
jgi:hypothetical protein